MATQRLTVATLIGDSGVAVDALFRSWLDGPAPEPATVDQFCDRLRVNGAVLPVVYFCEWVDRWLMGDEVPGPGKVEGRRYQAACLSSSEAVAWADHLGNQWPEQEWFAIRLREAVGSGSVADRFAVVVVRDVLGGSTTDGEIFDAMRGVPAWLFDDPSIGWRTPT